MVYDVPLLVFLLPEALTPSMPFDELSKLRTTCYCCFELLSWCSLDDGVVDEAAELSLFFFEVGDLGCLGFVILASC